MNITNGRKWFERDLHVVPHRPTLETNSTLTFLITTDEDVGDLLMVKMRWEKDAIISWSDWWGSSRFHIRKLRIKSGETQSKWVLPNMQGLQNISSYTEEVILWLTFFSQGNLQCEGRRVRPPHPRRRGGSICQVERRQHEPQREAVSDGSDSFYQTNIIEVK